MGDKALMVMCGKTGIALSFLLGNAGGLVHLLSFHEEVVSDEERFCGDVVRGNARGDGECSCSG